MARRLLSPAGPCARRTYAYGNNNIIIGGGKKKNEKEKKIKFHT